MSTSHKMKFTLQKLTVNDPRDIVKFDVVDASGTLCGRLCVPVEQERDLLAHWKEQPNRSAPASARGSSYRQNALISAPQASKRSTAPEAAPAAPRPKDMVSAMLAVAPKNRLDRAAILRSC